MRTPIKRGTARRLSLSPPLGRLLGVITVTGRIMSPEDYLEVKDRFTKALNGNWQFVYHTEDCPPSCSPWRLKR